jgi:mutual gliding-motility protein MglA
MPFWKKKPKTVEVRLKVIYYGPQNAGTSTNLTSLYELVKCQDKGEMTQMSMEDGEEENLLFFDLTPANVSLKDGYQLQCTIYRPFGLESRRLIVNGVNAIIFVADSSIDAQVANQQALQELESNLKNFSLSLDSIPWAIQCNKRDLPNIVDVDTMNRTLNTWHVPHYEAVASQSKGVVEPFDDLLITLTKNFDYDGIWLP